MSLVIGSYSAQEIVALPQEEERFQKVCEYLKVNASLLMLDIQQLQLTAEHRFEVAKQFVKVNPMGMLGLTQFRLTPEQYFALATQLVNRAVSYEDVSTVRHFPLLSEHRFILVMDLATKFPCEVVENINEMNIHDEAKKKEIYLQAAKTDFLAMIQCPHDIDVRPSHMAFFSENPGISARARQRISPALLVSLENYLKKIEEELKGTPDADRLLEVEMENVCAFVDFWHLGLQSEQLAWIGDHRFFEEICFVPDDIKLSLVQTIEEMANFSEDFSSLDSGRPLPFELLKLPLVQLIVGGLDRRVARDVVAFLDRQCHLLKDVKNFTSIYRTLEALATNTTLRGVQKKALLEELIRSPMQFLTKLTDLRILLDCDQSTLCSVPDEGAIPLHPLALESFQELFPKLDMTRYSAIFGRNRIPEAAMVYGSRLASLKNSLRDVALESFGNYLASVFDGSYKQKRYATEKNPHLEKIAQNYPRLLGKWMANWESSFTDLTEGSDENIPPSISMHEWLSDILLEQECIDNLEDYPYLLAFLQGKNSNAQQELIALKKSEEFKQLNPDEQRKIVLQSKLCLLATASSKEKGLELLKELKISSLVANLPVFVDFLKIKIKEIEADLFASNLTIVFTDNSEDMMVFGHEGKVTCQNYDGIPDVNIGLLGSLQNGQTKLIAVKNSEGKIIARALFRLLWDGTQPVLFLDTIYTHQKDLNYKYCKEAIHKMAELIGIETRCLVTSVEGTGGKYSKKLESLLGVAPYEYVDGINGLAWRGKFKLPKRPNLLT